MEAAGNDWITVAPGRFYPDYVELAVERYEPAMERFGLLANDATTSEELLRAILSYKDADLRRPMTRIFRRYVAPTAPVEQMKRVGDVERTVSRFSDQFRTISEVRTAFATRPLRDEALAAVLWEHQERGKRGAELTEQFKEWVKLHLPGMDVRGGRDIPLNELFTDYPTKRGVDFVIAENDDPIAVGYLHYDSDRGGSQESDRTGGYADAAEEIGEYLNRAGSRTKILFVNDGPGLLLGAMWRKYAALEDKWPKKVLVATLKMLPTRLSVEWLRS